MMDVDESTLLLVANLRVDSDSNESSRKVSLLDGITFKLQEGETVGIIGESGSGKSLLLKAILGMVSTSAGAAYFAAPIDSMKKAASLEERYKGELPETGNDRSELLQLRSNYSISGRQTGTIRKIKKNIQVVFQDPRTSLDPKKTVWEAIAESFKRATDLTDSEIEARVKEASAAAGLRETDLVKYPQELGVEQMQIVNIIRTISVEPRIAILDDPTSAMDTSAQAQILNTLRDYQYARGVSYLVASNDLNAIRVLSDRVIVLYHGRVLEYSSTLNIYTGMLHPFTKMLIANSLSLQTPRSSLDNALSDHVPLNTSLPRGCIFHTRCPVAFKDCGWSPSELKDLILEVLIVNRKATLSLFPAHKDVRSVDESDEIHITFEGNSRVSYEFVEELNRLIEARSMLEGGKRLEAVKGIELSPTGDDVIIKVRKPQTPPLMEVRPGHFAACFQYGGIEEEPKDEPGKPQEEKAPEVSNDQS